MADVGEILKALNDFGRFQHWLVLMITLTAPFTAFHIFGQLFMVIPVSHRCNTSWLDATSLNLTEEEQLNLTIPRKLDGTLEQCLMYSPVDHDLETLLQSGLNSTERCQDGWVYPSKSKPSLITQFTLICDRKDLIGISQSIFMSGLLVGAMGLGPFSDWYGRRPTALFSVFLQGVCGVAAAFAPSFYLYCALRFLLGVSLSGTAISNVALCTEWVGLAYRPHTIIIGHVAFSLGQMILAGLAYGLQDWRHLQLAGSAPIFSLLVYVWILPESARWLVTKGRTEEAKKLLQRAASVNKRTIPPELLEQLKPENNAKPARVLDLLRNPHLAKVTLVISSVWFANSLAYYGLSLNVGSFGLNIYLTQVIFGAVEIPARTFCIFLMQWLGRKKCQFLCLFLGGTFCLLITAVPKDLPEVVTTLAVLGKFTMSGSFSTSYVYSAELFPTVVRQTGLGVNQMTARLAGIISPLVGLLGKYHTSLPVVVLGSVAVFGGILSLLLPETMGKELSDHMDDVPHNSRHKEAAKSSVENGCAKTTEDKYIHEKTRTTSF